MVPESRRINFMAKPERKQLKNNPREKHNRPNPHTFFTASPPNSFFSTGYAERRQSVRPGFLYFYIFCDFHESRMYFRVSFSAEKGIYYIQVSKRSEYLLTLISSLMEVRENEGSDADRVRTGLS